MPATPIATDRARLVGSAWRTPAACLPRLLVWGVRARLTACGALREGRVETALFPSVGAAAPVDLASGRLALIVPPAVLDRAFTGERLRAALPTAVRVPSGRIVDAALARALQRQFDGGVVPQQAAPAVNSDVVATVAVTDVQFSYDERLRYFIPIPIPLPGMVFVHKFDVSLQIGFELQLLDARGRPLWARRYDSGRILWTPPDRMSTEQSPEGVLRLAHEAAWQLAQQAALDVRAWLDAERRQERQL